jgi:type IV pilus assembly protein PilE
MKFNSRQRGVTLIELVVVMIIVGILTAVAIPSYRAYVLRSQRSDAKDALLALATQQEKFYLQCNSYATAIAAANNCGAGQLQGTATSKNGWYNLAIDPGFPPLTNYRVSATAAAGGSQFADGACRTFRVTDSGVRTAATDGGADNSATCW